MKSKNKSENNSPNFHKKRNTQDLIFNFLLSHVKEFPELITGYSDIESRQPRNQINNLLKKSELDSLFIRKNGAYLNIEHQLVLNTSKILKNVRYILLLMEEGKEVEQIIVYTGYQDVKKYFATNDIFVKTGLVETRKIDASIRLNNIYFKINNNQELNAYDISDACILPLYNDGKSNEEIIDNLVYITKHCRTTDFLFKILGVCVCAWTNYLLIDKNKIDKIIGDLEMMGEIGFKEMWDHIQYERYMGLIELKDEEINQKDEEINQKDEELNQKDEEINQKDETIFQQAEALSQKDKTIERLLQYAPDDVVRDLSNNK